MTDRWIPTTEPELAAALDDGRLDEGPHLDFKRELTAGKKANVELARDLAMFANDGGTLIFGVDEPDVGRYVAAPVSLDGLRERIEQVATSRLDPPLHVAVTTIPTHSDPTLGYVVVRVPASVAAPHMVDGRYYGRAGTTRWTLSDAQVRAVIASRQAASQPLHELLDADIARDPIPAHLRTNAHLHVVARPRFAPDDIVLADVVERAGGNWSTWFYTHLFTAPFDPPPGRKWAPDLNSGAFNVGRRADGAAVHDYYIGQDRSAAELLSDPQELQHKESRLLDLEINEGGTLHLYCGRGSDARRNAGEVLLPAVVAGLVLRVVQVAARITELTGYIGTWDFAVAVTGLRGVILHTQGWGDPVPAYSAEDYRKTTAADTPELVTDRRLVADRLVGQLLRGFGVDGGVNTVLPPSHP